MVQRQEPSEYFQTAEIQTDTVINNLLILLGIAIILLGIIAILAIKERR